MAQPKNSEVLLDLAQRIVNVFSDGREDSPYISQEESARVLQPVLGGLRVEIRLPTANEFFRNVDTNRDQRIDVIELATFFECLKNFNETSTMIADL